MKLRAAAMYYALAVSLIIAVLLTAIITLAYSYKINSLRTDINSALVSNSLSGIEYLKSSSSSNGIYVLDLYDKGSDSVKLIKKQWGLFEVLAAEAFRGKNSFSKVGMFGSEEIGSNQVALYLSGDNKSLSVSGNTIIRGLAYLPAGGIKRVSIEGKHFVGSELVYGNILESSKDLPKLDSRIKIMSFTALKQNANVVNYEDVFQNGSSIQQSFLDSILIIYASSDIVLSKLSFKGNVVIYSENKVTIKSNAEIEDVLVIAKSIIVEDNFEGQVQLMAKDSIIIHEQVQLSYPSSLLLDNNEQGKIVLEKGAKIEGGIVIIGNADVKRHSFLFTQEKSEIVGDVYVDGKTFLKGKIYGGLYTRGFYLKTASGVYENYLLDVEIDLSKKPEHFISPYLFGDKGNMNVIKWLE